MPRRLDRAAAPWILTLFLLAASLDASAKAPILTDVQRIKQLQRQILLREPMERREALERGAKAWQNRSRKAGARIRRPGPLLNDLAAARHRDFFARAQTAALSAVQTPTNFMMNDSTGEDGVVQSEISMASHGNNVIAVWNDGIGSEGTGETNWLGYGYSTDGGMTWTDGGAPRNTGIGNWASDPVVVVNEKTGEFYLSGLADQPSAATNSIALVRGTFSGSTFSWGTPRQVVVVPNSLALLDKEWIAVDSLSGNVYCSYSYFAGNSDEIRVQRSTNDGQTWGNFITLSSLGDAGNVQGSRPAIGPNGEVYVVWHAIGLSNSPIGVGPDFLRVRRSSDFGVSYAAETTPASIFSNFGSGAPGFNRGLGITFPGIAVDRGTGPHRGRVYVSWSEAVNFPNDHFPQPGIDPAYSEVESNDGALTANPFSPGTILRGTVGLPADLDYFRWSATQGTTYVFWVDSLSMNLDASLRVFCTNAENPSPPYPTNLAFSQNGSGGQELIVFTAPTTAAYYLRIASYTQKNTGKYRILTTVHDTSLPGRSRDQRDVFIASSDNGGTWSTPVQANDSPPYFDDWLPEVAVDGRGRVFVSCYDWRDSPALCGGGSNDYLYESTDGGASFGPGTRISDFTTDWSNTVSDIIPNQGDYISLFARDSVLFVAWADCRGFHGDPNAFSARLGTICDPAPITAISALGGEDSLVVTWSAQSGTAAEVYRRDGAGAFDSLGTRFADASNHVTYTDTTVVLGHTYTYRLGVEGFCQPFVGLISATITPPRGPELTILATWPNPANHGDLNVSFVLDGTPRPAFLTLLDVSGRQWKRMDLPEQGPYVVSLLQDVQVPPGMYFVRLSQGGVTRSRRVSIFP